MISRAEFDFWRRPGLAGNADLVDTYGGPDAFAAYITRTAGVLNAVRDQLRLMEPAEEIAPGVHIADTAGHTAGHIGLHAQSENEQLLIVDDAITNVHVAFDHPRRRFHYDDYAERAIRTRVQVLERAASEGLLISGYHPVPGDWSCVPRRR